MGGGWGGWKVNPKPVEGKYFSSHLCEINVYVSSNQGEFNIGPVTFKEDNILLVASYIYVCIYFINCPNSTVFAVQICA